MPMFKTCTACKETFIAESPFIKLGTKKPNAAAKRKKRNAASLRNARNGVSR